MVDGTVVAICPQEASYFDLGARLHARVKAAAMDNGLLCYPAGGTIDGRTGDHILLAPPYIVSEVQIDEIVIRLGMAMDAAPAGAKN
jgi:hypothetical protein